MSDAFRVINIRTRRPPDEDDPLICTCGSWWFGFAVRPGNPPDSPLAVTFNRGGDVTGYTGLPVCIECGATPRHS